MKVGEDLLIPLTGLSEELGAVGEKTGSGRGFPPFPFLEPSKVAVS